MQRTLLVTLEYPPQIGGVARYYKGLADELPPASISVLDNSRHALLFQSRWLWPRWLKGFWSVYRTVRREQVQHLLVGQVLPLGTIAWLLHQLLGLPYTVMTHAMDVTVPLHSGHRRAWLLKLILQSADQVTTVSHYTAQVLHEQCGVPTDRIHIIYPCPGSLSHTGALDLTDRYPQLKQRPVILSAARLVERKGFDVLLRTHQQVVEEVPEALCVIVGAGEQETALRQLALELGLEKSILFTGAVNDEELAAWYERCTLFALLPRQLTDGEVEGFGIVFLEAAQAGKPVVAGRSGGVPDAVVDGETGLLVTPEDARAAAAAILQLMTDPEFAQRTGAAGRARVQALFQWPVQARLLEDLLQ